MSTASFDTDLGYETLCSKMELNSSSSSSPSNGGYESIKKNNLLSMLPLLQHWNRDEGVGRGKMGLGELDKPPLLPFVHTLSP